MVVAKSLQFGLTEVHTLLYSTADINHLFLLGIHAREWISPATALWTIHAVLSDERMMEELDWFIHPIVNPDGFTFTHEHVIVSYMFKTFFTCNIKLQTRLWRKTRSDHGSILFCRGVDGNRNYGHHWNGQNRLSNV